MTMAARNMDNSNNRHFSPFRSSQLVASRAAPADSQQSDAITYPTDVVVLRTTRAPLLDDARTSSFKASTATEPNTFMTAASAPGSSEELSTMRTSMSVFRLQPRSSMTCSSTLSSGGGVLESSLEACRGRKRPAHSISIASDNNTSSTTRLSTSTPPIRCNMKNEETLREKQSVAKDLIRTGDISSSPGRVAALTFQGLSLHSPKGPRNFPLEGIGTRSQGGPSGMEPVCAFSKYKGSNASFLAPRAPITTSCTSLDESSKTTGQPKPLPLGASSSTVSSKSSHKYAPLTVLTHTQTKSDGTSIKATSSQNKRPPLPAGAASFFLSLNGSQASASEEDSAHSAAENTRTPKRPLSMVDCHDTNASGSSISTFHDGVPSSSPSTFSMSASFPWAPPLPRVNLTPRSIGSGSRGGGASIPRFPSPSEEDESLELMTPTSFLPLRRCKTSVAGPTKASNSANNTATEVSIEPESAITMGPSPSQCIAPKRSSYIPLQNWSNAFGPLAVASRVQTRLHTQTTSLLHPSPHPGGSLSLPGRGQQRQGNSSVDNETLSDIDDDQTFILAPPALIQQEKQPDLDCHAKHHKVYPDSVPSMASMALSAGQASSTSLRGMDFVGSNNNLNALEESKDSAKKTVSCVVISNHITRPESECVSSSIGLVLETATLPANISDDSDKAGRDLMVTPPPMIPSQSPPLLDTSPCEKT